MAKAQTITSIVRRGPSALVGRMGRLAGVAIGTASVMLLMVAIPLNSAALFYMSTAMIVTLVASRVQALWAVRGLRVERYGPDIVRVGEEVTIDLTLWTETHLKRPLISLEDQLPERLVVEALSPSLPIAPAYGHPVQTHYKFRPMRRGRYRWSRLTAVGTDALGLIALGKDYEADPMDLTVLPAPIPLSFDLNSAAGWGFTETDHGLGRGHGIQPRGIREYSSGDSLRYVHWKSTARRGELLVKEFETGAQSSVAFLMQLTEGSDVGQGAKTTLEHMCGNLAYLSGTMLRQGIDLSFPGLDGDDVSAQPVERENQILMMLAEIQANRKESISDHVSAALPTLPTGTHLYVLISVVDEGLPDTIQRATQYGDPVTVLIYDPRIYCPKPFPAERSAANQAFSDRLAAAGARIAFVGEEIGK